MEKGEKLLNPQKDNFHHYRYVSYIRKLFLKTVLTKPVWSQVSGNEYVSPTSQAKEDDRGVMEVLQEKQDVIDTQTAKYPTPQGLARDRVELCEYLIALLSVSSVPSVAQMSLPYGK